MSNYWVERQMTAKKKISEKTEADIKRQLNKYYSNAMKRTIADFEATYDKLLATVEEGREPTPADLYKLDKYWQSQAQLKKELQALGDKEVELLSKNFEKQWKKIYETTAIKSNGLFNTVSSSSAEQMINTSWLSDNKTFSQRIWGNIEKLTETLNEKLVDCVITGKKTTELNKILQERFNVSYNQADTLVRTEIANIQVQAAAQRYKDSGLKYYEFFADPDERTCSKCKALEGKKFLYSEMKPGVNAPPMHPRDRCDILPVIDNESEEIIMERKKYELTDVEKEQLKKVYEMYPEISDLIKQKQYRLELGIDAKEGLIRKAQSALDGEWKLEYFFKQENLRKWDGRKKQYVMPKNPEQFAKDYQNQLRKEIEEYQEEINKSDYDVWKLYTYCIDCGKPIPKEGKTTNAQKRCPECQAKYRKRYKAQKEKERRERKKKK